MPHAIRIHEHGGPEVLRWEAVDSAEPAAGQIALRQTAIGLNFIDVYHRSGLYPVKLPATLGREAAGVIEALGAGVSDLSVGDRVAYPLCAGAYAERRTIDADLVVPLPDGVDDRTAAAVILKGLTAHYLLRRIHRVASGETVLIHAAAGGVGLIACQWAAALGATVIGTVGSPEKAELARALGCHHPLLYREIDFAAEVRRLTDGRGVPVVYDSVGAATFDRSLECLAPRGTMVSFGQSSGAVPPLDIGVLAARGSLMLTRPTLATFIARRDDLLAAADELFARLIDGSIRVRVGDAWPLASTADAHRALESRATSGSTLLLP